MRPLLHKIGIITYLERERKTSWLEDGRMQTGKGREEDWDERSVDTAHSFISVLTIYQPGGTSMFL